MKRINLMSNLNKDLNKAAAFLAAASTLLIAPPVLCDQKAGVKVNSPNTNAIAVGGPVAPDSAATLYPPSASGNGLSLVMPSGGAGNAIKILNTSSPIDDTITTTGTGLVLSETGDTFGECRLHVENRNGLNGALFENVSLPLVDFGFSVSGGIQRNIRMEARNGYITSGSPEFQIGGASVGPNVSTLIVGDNAVVFNEPVTCRAFSPASSSALQRWVNSNNMSQATLSAGGGITNSGYLNVLAVSSPAISSITTNGTAGTTSYYYVVTAKTGAGETLPGSEVSLATGNPTLSTTNFNTVTWAAVAGAERYDIYRSTTPGTEQRIAFGVYGTTYSDTGAGGTVSPPTANTTGYVNSPVYKSGGTPGLTTTTQVTTPTGTETLHFSSGLLTSITTP